MEGSRRRDSSSLPVFADLSVTEGRRDYQSNLSESDMISNSFLTVENSKIRSHPMENSAKTTWTNEKHAMYLDHLESSFVKQLHQSVFTNHPRCAGKQHFVRATKKQDSSTAMNLGSGDSNIYFNETGLSTGQIFERHGKSLDYFEEFSDQNFPDEAREQMRVATVSKRSKTIVS